MKIQVIKGKSSNLTIEDPTSVLIDGIEALAVIKALSKMMSTSPLNPTLLNNLSAGAVVSGVSKAEQQTAELPKSVRRVQEFETFSASLVDEALAGSEHLTTAGVKLVLKKSGLALCVKNGSMYWGVERNGRALFGFQDVGKLYDMPDFKFIGKDGNPLPDTDPKVKNLAYLPEAREIHRKWLTLVVAKYKDSDLLSPDTIKLVEKSLERHIGDVVRATGETSVVQSAPVQPEEADDPTPPEHPSQPESVENASGEEKTADPADSASDPADTTEVPAVKLVPLNAIRFTTGPEGCEVCGTNDCSLLHTFGSAAAITWLQRVGITFIGQDLMRHAEHQLFLDPVQLTIGLSETGYPMTLNGKYPVGLYDLSAALL